LTARFTARFFTARLATALLTAFFAIFPSHQDAARAARLKQTDDPPQNVRACRVGASVDRVLNLYNNFEV
jgi:hypothetical protein